MQNVGIEQKNDYEKDVENGRMEKEFQPHIGFILAYYAAAGSA